MTFKFFNRKIQSRNGENGTLSLNHGKQFILSLIVILNDE
jgi:hypothetical protein